jgi:hypothetical protein
MKNDNILKSVCSYSKNFMAFVLILSLISGCGGGGGSTDTSGENDRIPSDGNPSELAMLDLSDAQALLVASSSSGSISSPVSSGNATLFKIDSNDVLHEVAFIDGKGNYFPTSDIETLYVEDLSSEYIFLSVWKDNGQHYGILVRKSDGAVFSSNEAGRTNKWIGRFATGLDKNVADGRFYYVFWQSTDELRRIDVSDPNNIIDDLVSPAPEIVSFSHLDDLVVDPDGNALFSSKNTSTNEQKVRLVKNSGAIDDLSDLLTIHANGFVSNFLGPDGKLYSISRSDFSDDKYHTPILRILINEDDPATVETFAILESIAPSRVGGFRSWGSITEFTYLPEKVIATDGQYFAEVYNPAGTPYEIDSLKSLFNEVFLVRPSLSNYYILGLRASDDLVALYKVDAATHTPALLLLEDDFETYRFTVSEDDTVYFHALRSSDGAVVTGIIDSSGNVSIINELIDRDISSLTRVF